MKGVAITTVRKVVPGLTTRGSNSFVGGVTGVYGSYKLQELQSVSSFGIGTLNCKDGELNWKYITY